jgi:hypothetical protein
MTPPSMHDRATPSAPVWATAGKTPGKAPEAIDRADHRRVADRPRVEAAAAEDDRQPGVGVAADGHHRAQGGRHRVAVEAGAQLGLERRAGSRAVPGSTSLGKTAAPRSR